MMADYAAWLVDFDGTLYRAPWVKFAMAVELGLGGWAAIRTVRAFRHCHEGMRLDGHGDCEDPYRLQLEQAAGRLGLDRAAVESVVDEWMIRRPCRWVRLFRRYDLIQSIGAFREGGGRTAIVSDYPVSEKLGALNAAHLFDAVVANGEPGGPRRLKPSPEGYLLAAERLNVSPARCLVIGDRDDADGAAARAAGMGFRLVR